MVPERPIRVLVADDSAFMRHTLATKVLADPGIEVVGTARDGIEALEQASRLRPDVITLDVEMPRLNGIDALRQIMRDRPTPVVMLSSLTQGGAEATIRALEIGAIDFVTKPSGSISLDIQSVRTELIEKIRHAARFGARNLLPGHRPATQPAETSTALDSTTVSTSPRRQVDTPVLDRSTAAQLGNLVVIGASTGGPRALREVVSRWEGDSATAVLIVQHMPAGFTRPLAGRLNELTAIEVREAVHGEQPTPGTALVAPGDFHLWLDRSGRIELGQGPRVHGVRPSVDVTLESAARLCERGLLLNLLAVVLTGMGSDGKLGAAAVRAAGGLVLAEHESSCVVYGMPRSVVEAGYASEVVPLDRMAQAISRVIGKWNKRRQISTGSSFSSGLESSPASI